MRKQLLGVFLPLLVLVLMAAAETQSTGTQSAGHATLQKVDVVHGEDGISVEITGRGQLRPELSTADSPARLVVDLPATVMATSHSHIGVGSDGVKGVRIGMDAQTPPTTRVVIDLAQACRYELLPSTDSKFTVKLYTAANTSKSKTKPAATPVANLVVAQVPSVKKELAMNAPASVLAIQKKQLQPASSATEFVFVEPSYKTKDTIAAEVSKTSLVRLLSAQAMLPQNLPIDPRPCCLALAPPCNPRRPKEWQPPADHNPR